MHYLSVLSDDDDDDIDDDDDDRVNRPFPLFPVPLLTEKSRMSSLYNGAIGVSSSR
jgi:hypothetical protein